MLAIYKKEMRTYFTTPLGYAFIAVFLAVSGFIFAFTTFQSQTSDVSGYFQMMIFGYIVLVPLLTMRSFAMVFAKFLAALTMFAGTVLVSCVYYLPLFGYGEPNVGRAVGCLIAMLLLGGAFIAVGIFVSTLTESTVNASIGTMGILLLFVVAAIFNNLIDAYVIRAVLSWISVYSRYVNFTYGIFDVAAAVYYLSITGIFLFLAVRMCERRRYA